MTQPVKYFVKYFSMALMLAISPLLFGGAPETTNQGGPPGGVVSSTVQFILKPLFTGSAQPGQVQFFEPNSNTNIETPFGVPFWGSSLTSGPWLLVVHSSGGSAACPFTVAP